MIAWYWFVPIMFIGCILFFFLGAFVASAGFAGRLHDLMAAEEAQRVREAQARLN